VIITNNFFLILIFLFVSGFDSNNVVLKNYESSFTGLIQSWIERFPNLDTSQTLIELWNKDKHHFVSTNN